MNNKIITYNGDAKVEEEDVKFTLKLSFDLNAKVVSKAKESGLSKLAYIRFVLSQSVKEV